MFGAGPSWRRPRAVLPSAWPCVAGAEVAQPVWRVAARRLRSARTIAAQTLRSWLASRRHPPV